MKRLTLVRHGNADWKDSSIADFERALNRRGSSEAASTARRLLEQHLVAELVLVSPAVRTMQTAQVFAQELDLSAQKIKRDDRLYLAAPEDILLVIQETGARIEHLMVIGHNPGISELARQLTGASTLGDFPTGAAFTMTLDAGNWSGLTAGKGKQISFDLPKGLFRLWAF